MGSQSNGLSFDRQACSEEAVRFWEESRTWLPGPRGCLRGKKAHVFWDLENVPLVWLHDSYVLAPNKHFNILSRVFREYLEASEFEITFYISDHSLKCQKESWSRQLPGSAINGLIQDLFQLHPGVSFRRPLGSEMDGDDGTRVELKKTSHGVDEFMKKDIQKVTARFNEGDVVCLIAGDTDFRIDVMEMQAARRLQVLLMTRDFPTTSQQWWSHLWAGSVKWHCYLADFMKWHCLQVEKRVTLPSQVESAQVPPAWLHKPAAQPNIERKVLPSCLVEEPQVTRVLYVHEEDIKFFMGPRGCIHKEIQLKYRCNIRVKQEFRVEEQEPVLVSGLLDQVDGGVKAVIDKLDPQHMFDWSLIPGYFFYVPFKQAWPLLCDRGEYIRSLKEQTGTDIITEQDDVPGLPTGMKIFRILGAPEDVKRACRGMHKRLADTHSRICSAQYTSSKPKASPPPTISNHSLDQPQHSCAAPALSYLSVVSGTHRGQLGSLCR